MEGKRSGGNDTKDAYARLLERLSCFAREYSIECKLYGTSDGIGIDDLIGDDDVTVLESKVWKIPLKTLFLELLHLDFINMLLHMKADF